MSTPHRGIDIAQWRSQLPLSAPGGPGSTTKLSSTGYASLPPLPLTLPVAPRLVSSRPAHARPVPVATHAEDIPLLVGGQSDSDATSTNGGLTSPSEVDSLADKVEIVGSSREKACATRGVAATTTTTMKQVDGQRAERETKKVEADRLVDSTLELLNAIWPFTTSHPSSPSSIADVSDGSASDEEGGVSLRTFVNEILRRSRSSCATLRAARWYLQRAAILLPAAADRTASLACPRRTFLSAMVLANKFLHDRVYSNKAWGKVSGLETKEISMGETALGSLLDWTLWVRDEQTCVTPPASPYTFPTSSFSPEFVVPCPTGTSIALRLHGAAGANEGPALIPLQEDRPSWKPKRPLGPGPTDPLYVKLIGGSPSRLLLADTVQTASPEEDVQEEGGRKRRFGHSKSFAPGGWKKARVERDGEGEGWEDRMRTLVV